MSFRKNGYEVLKSVADLATDDNGEIHNNMLAEVFFDALDTLAPKEGE